MKKLYLIIVFIIFFIGFSNAQQNKDYLKNKVRINYNTINHELITKSYFISDHNIFIEVYNITGNFIKRFKYSTNTQIFSDFLFLKQGIYIIKVFDNKTYYTKRIIVK